MSQNKNALFAEDSDDSGTEDNEWKVNNSYAKNYKQWRRKEEIVKLKSRFGEDAELSDDSDSETSDDEFVEPDNPEFDRDFLLAMGALHQKDKQSLKDVSSFFKDSYVSNSKKKEEKPMTLKDYERHIIMNRDGKFEDDNEDASFSGNSLKKPVASEFDDGGVSSEDDDDLLTSGLFKINNQDKEQPNLNDSKENHADVLAFVKGEVETVGDSKEQDLLRGLKEAWANPNNSKKDKWLTDFFINKRYQDEEDESIERAYNEVIIDEETLSEDENTLAKMEAFETKYRFRYEEPDQEFIKHHPRNIPDSMRQKDEKRKEKREEVKQRKEDDKERKRQEIQQLKALKLQEIQEKIQKIKEISGNDDIGDQILSDDDFDPDKHDAQMSQFYGDDYYADDNDGDEKPVFEDDEIYENYDEWLEKEGEGAAGGGQLKESEEYTEEKEVYFEDDPNFNMDCDYDPSQESLQEEILASTSKRKGRKKSKFAKALAKKKPVFNPDEKNFDSYFEEYYKMDFEDIVGGMPCRFKYRKVEANNFGLSTEEILSAKDKELNRWFPVRKMVRYGRSQGEETKDRNNYKNRASQLHVKQKILPSLFVENPEENHIEEEERKRLKNQKKKQKRLEKQKLAELMAQNETIEEEITEEKHQIQSDSKSKKKKINNIAENEYDAQIEEENEPKRKKKKVVLSNKDNMDEPIPSISEDKESKKKKKKKKKDRSNENYTNESHISNSQNIQVSEVTPSVLIQEAPKDTKSQKKQKRRKKITNNPFPVKNSQDGLDGISDARLLAYGANPKKIKNKAKYGKKKDM